MRATPQGGGREITAPLAFHLGGMQRSPDAGIQSGYALGALLMENRGSYSLATMTEVNPAAVRRTDRDLRIPGPTPLPAAVRRALASPMINHRGPEFAALLAELTAGVQRILRTEHDVLLFPGSGTGGLEASLVNTLSPSDRVLAITIGAFGDRYADIAESFGLAVERYAVEWGQAADPDEVRRRLRAAPATRAVLVTHNETSTGVTNDLPAIAATVQSYSDALLLVDGVSSLAALPFAMDELGVDVVVTGSQKAWMVPPSLLLVGVGPRAWAAARTARLPRYYWDFQAQREAQARGVTPYTPPLSQMFALQAALGLIEDEGLAAVYERHRQVGGYTRRGLARLGFALAADPAHASNTVTAARPPQGVAAPDLLRRVRERHGIVLARGQGKWADEVLRVGHLGRVNRAAIRRVLQALAHELGDG